MFSHSRARDCKRTAEGNVRNAERTRLAASALHTRETDSGISWSCSTCPQRSLRCIAAARSHRCLACLCLNGVTVSLLILLPKLRGSDSYPGGTVSHRTRQPSLDAQRQLPGSHFDVLNFRTWPAAARRGASATRRLQRRIATHIYPHLLAIPADEHARTVSRRNSCALTSQPC